MGLLPWMSLLGYSCPLATQPSPSQEQLPLSRTLWGWAFMTPQGGSQSWQSCRVAELWVPQGCVWWDTGSGEGWCCLWHAEGCQAQCLLLAPGAGTTPREWAQILPKTQTKEEACVGTDRFLCIEGLHQGQECFCLKLKQSFQSKLKLTKATTNICDLLTKAFLAILEITLYPL